VATDTDKQQAAHDAGHQYGTLAANLCLVHVSGATTEEAVQEHVADLARNIREQAAHRADEGLR
jgi:hypothetical protein